MIDLLQHPNAFPFTVSLTIMAGLAVLEAVSLLFGAGLSGFLDDLLPDSLDADVDANLDMEHAGVVSKAFGWLKINEVPGLVALILFLLCFGLTGLALQWAMTQSLGAPIGAGAAVVASLLACLPILRGAITVIGPVIPKDETDVVSQGSFIGASATVVLGDARSASPAQAKLFDKHGQAHYLMVEPADADAVLSEGTEVILIEHQGTQYLAKAVSLPKLKQEEDPLGPG